MKKWGYKIIIGPFKDCNCPSHCEAGYYEEEDFKRRVASSDLEEAQKMISSIFNTMIDNIKVE